MRLLPLELFYTFRKPLEIFFGIWGVTRGFIQQVHFCIHQHIERLRIVPEIQGLESCPLISYCANLFYAAIWPHVVELLIFR